MVWDTDKGLASHIKENQNTIKYQRHDWIDNKTLKLLSKDDNGDFEIGEEKAIDVEPKGLIQRCQLILEWLSLTSS